jgi:putative ABC transport system ATP-binding protein
MSVPLLQLRGVTKSYTEGDTTHVVLHGIDTIVGTGQFVALLGPSGSGKSTLLNLISGIDTPDAGEIRIEDTDITRLSERERTLLRRARIGFIFQFYNLIPTLTVEENLLLPLELNGLLDKRGREGALRLLERVGLRDRASTFPDRLSGGEQQRVAIARALVHNPALLLADEPTGNLDTDTGVKVLDLLDELTRGAGKTVLVVTHSDDVVQRADRVMRLRDGHLVEDWRSP